MAQPELVKQDDFVLIVHEVEDYDRWKAVFDEAAHIRKEAGEIEYQLLRYEDDPSRIVHFSRWISNEAARQFFESSKLVRIRREAGVIAPKFNYLNEIEQGRL